MFEWNFFPGWNRLFDRIMIVFENLGFSIFSFNGEVGFQDPVNE